MNKNYICCVCGREYTERLIRLVEQKYGIGNYNQYSYYDKFDICTKCLIKFERWVHKIKKEGV